MPANDISSWECILRIKDRQCRTTVKLSPTGEFTEQVKDHTHVPCPIQVKMTKIKVGIKHKTKATEETVQQILCEQLGNISEDTTVNLPLIAKMRRNIYKAREDDKIPQILLNREDTYPYLPNRYLLTKSREPFLMFDSGEGDRESMFIFSSEIGICFSSESEHWFSDGTFRVWPEVFF